MDSELRIFPNKIILIQKIHNGPFYGSYSELNIKIILMRYAQIFDL